MLEERPSLRESLASLDELFGTLMSPTGDVAKIEAQEFADAWQGARHFRDQTLLVLARYTFSAFHSGEISTEDVSQRLVDFAFRFLTLRQAAFAADLAGTLIDNEQFDLAALNYSPNSNFYTAAKGDALACGLSGAYFFEPEKLVSIVNANNPRAQALLASAQMPPPLDIKPLFRGMDEQASSNPVSPPPEVEPSPFRSNTAWITATDVEEVASPVSRSIELLGVSTLFKEADARERLDTAFQSVADRLGDGPDAVDFE